MCFEPTYKGLKPHQKAYNRLTTTCFEPTYKGLKRPRGPRGEHAAEEF